MLITGVPQIICETREYVVEERDRPSYRSWVPIDRGKRVKEYDVKKNDRLRDFQKVEQQSSNKEKLMIKDDPYSLPTYYGQCAYCDEIDANFAKQFVLENHYAESCKMMTSCRYCQKVVLISQLTDHYISRCDFLKNKKVRCKLCGLATEREDDEADVDHPLCRGRPPPSGAQWCPLCAVAVDDNRESWVAHTTKSNGCYNNPRMFKVNDSVRTDLVPDTLVLSGKPRSGTARGSGTGGRGSGAPGGAGGQGGMGGSQPDAVYHGPSVDMRGKRLIDADQLLSALKVANQRKKAQKKKAMQAQAEKSEDVN